LTRRLYIAAFAVLAGIASAAAQTYPSRPITVIVPFPPGGASDTLTRVLIEHMKGSLGQPLIIENVAGAGGGIGGARVARAAPDGYTLGIGHWGTHVVIAATSTLQYDVATAFEPVALLANTPQWIIAKKNFPARDLKEMIAWLKANPHKASAATVGVAGAGHVAGVYFQNHTGTRFQFVPYRGGGPAIQDLVAGHVDLMFDQSANSFVQVRGGQVNVYAVMAKNRWALAPDVPTVDEAGAAGLYTSFWHGLWAPKGTSGDVVAKLSGAVMAALADANVRQRFADIGQEIWPVEQQTPDALAAHHKAEIAKWWPIIKASGLRAQ
jgi:tripartite-type tricarboxylate transporter receptor subunit TctC